MNLTPDRVLTIIRGLPGSGKSYLASLLAPSANICTTDDYPGLYTYSEDGLVTAFHGLDPDDEFGVRIVAAHNWNQTKAIGLMEDGASHVVNPNTNTERWEFQPYLDAAETYGYRVVVISVFDGGLTDDELFDRNSHGVPLGGIAAMRARFQHDWKDAPRYREEQ